MFIEYRNKLLCNCIYWAICVNYMESFNVCLFIREIGLHAYTSISYTPIISSIIGSGRTGEYSNDFLE